jgi:D-specific alpha-keto acid dehydrogenase
VTSGRGITVYGCEADEAELFRALSPRFGIVPTTIGGPVSQETIASGSGNRCISVGHKSEITGPMLRALQRAGVEHLSTRSIGFDHIDLGAAAAAGITVQNVVYAPDGVADFTLMLILMAIRDATAIVGAVERHDYRHLGVRGGDLRDMTVGVVGVGNIGRAVVHRLRGFGCRVLAHSKRRDPAVPADFVAFDDLLRASDVVTLHVPLNAETHHLIGREQIATMQDGAVLVNTGRGSLVDTGALITALERGKLGGAALDVLEAEEGTFSFDCTTRPDDHPFLARLLRLPNVIITPHTAYYTARALRDTVEKTLISCRDFERRRAHGAVGDRDLVRGLLGGA